ncbi:MAG: bifunctional 5,10-methylene-tetrahydrofolate dehydrogenase/5,10-methylene-tetrahydrofolate cyclohydrolase [Clostridiales bacterium]|nr:bifunctional 5,10-methylene-tetrahydrofolate dehydrogenase/5,10-methylene-tetrahydrofolate cyclohydrolase [Clostridiales bacterium]
MSRIIKGKPVADQISSELIKEIDILKSHGIEPKLCILRVGARPDDLAYERGALNRCKKLGIKTEVIELAENVSQEEFLAELEKLNKSNDVNGILIFKPLPEHLDESKIKNLIAPEKDVDCLNPVNIGKMTEGDKTGFSTCTPTAVIEMLKFYDIDIRGKDCTVIGASMVVGKPAALLLLNERATITVCHTSTKDIVNTARKADILVVGAGVARLVKEDWVKEGAIVIDIGINVDEDGNLCGDVDFENVKKKASMITPVPGGVGSVTTSILAKNIVKACKIQNNLL